MCGKLKKKEKILLIFSFLPSFSFLFFQEMEGDGSVGLRDPEPGILLVENDSVRYSVDFMLSLKDLPVSQRSPEGFPP